jgi:glycosyltransferase involved in cell wall biosynthesis
MRILTIVHNLDVGGAQGSAKNASLAYVERGQQVAVLAFRGGGPRVEPLRAAGVEVFVGGETDDDFKPALEAAMAWGPEVLHVHRSGHADESMLRIIRAIKASATRRIAVIETNIFGRVDASADVAEIDVHMLLTRYCLWKWRRWARGLTPPPIGAVAPNIVRSDGFYPERVETREAFRAEHGIPQDAIVFGRVGQPIRAKWSYAAFQAFIKFARQHPSAWFVAVGLPGAYEAYVNGIEPDVRRRIVVIDFLHGEAALRACYAALDVFLHSARIGESFGIVLAEAMLCERSVITLSTPAHDNSQLEVVGHERGGLVAANVDAMVEAMGNLADDPALRQRLGRQGRQWCLQHYDSPVVGGIMLRIAELALQHDDRAPLRAALEREPLLTTQVTDAEIHALLGRSIGRPSVVERVQVWMVHAPAVYRCWRIVRRVQRTLRGPGDKQRLIREREANRDAAEAGRARSPQHG